MAAIPTKKLYKGKDFVIVNVPIKPENDLDFAGKASFEENSKTIARFIEAGFSESEPEGKPGK